jgi:hypothetical protein
MKRMQLNEQQERWVSQLLEGAFELCPAASMVVLMAPAKPLIVIRIDDDGKPIVEDHRDGK